MRVSLRYNTFVTLNNVGVTHGNVRYIPTYCYDIDPTLGNTAMPGFGEWTSIYRFYRLRSSTIRCTFSNAEAFPMNYCVCPVNVDPGANTANWLNYFSSRLATTGATGPLTGNGVVTLSNHRTTEEMGGVASLMVLDGYCGASTTAPVNNWYWFVGFYNPATVASAGSLVNVEIDEEIEFFEVASPSA
jgi:hypothetical protein